MTHSHCRRRHRALEFPRRASLNKRQATTHTHSCTPSQFNASATQRRARVLLAAQFIPYNTPTNDDDDDDDNRERRDVSRFVCFVHCCRRAPNDTHKTHGIPARAACPDWRVMVATSFLTIAQPDKPTCTTTTNVNYHN